MKKRRNVYLIENYYKRLKIDAEKNKKKGDYPVSISGVINLIIRDHYVAMDKSKSKRK